VQRSWTQSEATAYFLHQLRLQREHSAIDGWTVDASWLQLQGVVVPPALAAAAVAEPPASESSGSSSSESDSSDDGQRRRVARCGTVRHGSWG
jgi:hypothetical protein